MMYCTSKLVDGVKLHKNNETGCTRKVSTGTVPESEWKMCVEVRRSRGGNITLIDCNDGGTWSMWIQYVVNYKNWACCFLDKCNWRKMR